MCNVYDLLFAESDRLAARVDEVTFVRNISFASSVTDPNLILGVPPLVH